jgi:hypothetical protein
LHSENYEVHGHILATVIKRCTYLKTANFFVRWIVNHARHRFVLLCKESNKLTGRKNETKKQKLSDYEAQALEMQTRITASDNVLWSGKNRLGMTKRIANCKCAITVSYERSEHVWHGKVNCASHTDHSDMKLPPKITLQTSVTEVLQNLRRDVGVSVAQQLKFCAKNNLHVTSAFIRRINSSTSADPAFGLSGDAGFIFALLTSQDKLDFCMEFELRDSLNASHQRITVMCKNKQFIHVQRRRCSDVPAWDHSAYGLHTRSDDVDLQGFYNFLVPFLIRVPGLKCVIKNCVWATAKDLEFLKKYPKVLMFDTTCKTNINNKHFGYGSGLTGNHEWFKGFSFVINSLQKQDFFWLWSVGCVALIDACVRLALQVVVTDGDHNMTDAIEGALAQRAWGDELTSRRRCIFHLLHLNFESEYPQFTCDGGVGIRCRDWLKFAGKKCQTKQEMMQAGSDIIKYIRELKSDGNFTDVAREKLVNWVSGRMMHTDLWCRYAFRHLHCSDVETTSPSEGAHHGLKSDIQVHSHCELATLLLADLLRTNQRYFEIEREAQERAGAAAAGLRVTCGPPAAFHVSASDLIGGRVRHLVFYHTCAPSRRSLVFGRRI